MADLKPKVVLKAKGQEAYVSIRQLLVTLSWTAAVDLDLMAFYRAKDGRVGGIFSDNYAGGSTGGLNNFPFIQLSGDAGVGAAAGSNQEELRIAKLDDLAEIFICAVNFTDASKGRSVAFNRYDGQVVVMDDKGDAVAVPLDSALPGTVAIIARIDNTSFMGAKLVNENRVVDLEGFRSAVPGAAKLEIGSKVVLKAKGDKIELKPKTGGGLGELVVNLNWNQGKTQPKGFLARLGGGSAPGIDLDLGCLFDSTDGSKGAIQALGKAWGAYDSPPYIQHMGDDRTGSLAEGENLRINGDRIAAIRRVLVYAFIYEGVSNWSQADGVVTIKQPGGPDIVVELDEHRNDRGMCAIALLQNSGGILRAEKVVQYFQGHEAMDKAFNWGLRWTTGRKD